MDTASTKNGGGLVAATQELETILLQNCQDQEVILDLIQKCCTGISGYFRTTPEDVPVKAVLDAVLVLKRTISTIFERATTAEQKLSILRLDFWGKYFFHYIQSCCFNEKWHAAFIENDTTPGHSLHASFQATTRDFIKEILIPFISDAVAAQIVDAEGLCLVAPLRFIADLAEKAANLIGWRDRRAENAPYLRNYGLVNALWMGVTKIWSAIPHPLQPLLIDHKSHGMLYVTDLSAHAIIVLLGGYLRSDFSTLCDKKLTTDVKLIQFWTVQMSKILAAYPETAKTVWNEAFNWSITAREQFSKLEAVSSEPATAVAEFVQAVREGSLFVRCARLQRQALSVMSVDLRASCLEDLKHILHSVRIFDAKLENQPPKFTFAAIVELLGQAGSMPAESRSDFFPLLKEAILCIPSVSFEPALYTAELRQNTADSFLVYILSLASSAASTENVAGAQQAWEECQLLLMECSMLPHPYVLSIMSTVWNSLIILSDGPTTKHFVAGMHELLASTVATETAAAAGEGTFKPSSPTAQQLTYLLGVLLAFIPKQVTESFYERFLKLDRDGVADLCQLASVSAVLRAVCFSGRPVGDGSIITKLILHVCQAVSRCVGVAITPAAKLSKEKIVKQSLPPGSLRLYLAWAVDCLGAALETLQSLFVVAEEYTLSSSMENAVGNVFKACMTILPSPGASTAPYLPPVLRTLSLVLRLLPAVPTPSELAIITSCMGESLHAMPAAAAGIAELTPVLSSENSPPRILFETLLGPSQSASLQFLGKEAYVKYAKECFDENVLGALPRQWLDPSGTKLSQQVQPVMEKYLSRTCSNNMAPQGTSLGVLHPSFAEKGNILDLKIKKEVEMAARDTGSKLAEKRFKAMEVSAIMVGEQKQQQALKATAIDTIPPPQIVSSSSSGMRIAAVQVMESVESLQKVWAPAGEGAAEAEAVVRQARDALSAVLARNTA